MPKHEYQHCKATILDTPEQIELFRLFQLKYALKIELDTGLRHSRGSILNAVNEILILNGLIKKPFRNKQSAFEALDAYIETKTKAFTDDPA